MGVVLLPKEDAPKRSAQRVLRIGLVLVVISVVYHCFYAWKDHTPIDLLALVRELPTIYSSNALWYLYLYLGLLCLLPILQRLVKALNRQLLLWAIFLSVGICGSLPVIQAFFPGVGLSTFFLQPLFSPYVGLVLCGYYVERYLTVTGKTALWAGGIFAGGIALQVAGTYLLYRRDPAPSHYLALDDRTSLLIALCAISFYVLVKYFFTRFPLSPKAEQGVCTLGGLTFGMYLFGDMAIELTRPLYAALNVPLPALGAVLLWELAVFALCALLTAGLKQIPGLKNYL
ncbi:MAG: hypothetical protein K2F83_06725, partial [Oscillospiraceae bacterium]|nr:hypothetical protein [Oscillospiraceae bacterium]